ncbi:MAG TPA: bifunctional phosphoglucose/phosphomannose isomerase [bacterium]|nr:bifunctional phosphoglucose/phosphomannose isomerase [bacterium]
MSALDAPARLRACDPSGMLECVLGLPRQIREAWRLGSAAPLPVLPDRTEHLVVCGMGGSAIGGDLLGGYLAPRVPVPVTVVRGYDLPAFVGRRSIVIAASYSGTTEETLAAAAQAERAGAVLFAVTSGGTLEETARRAGVVVPGGLAPRAALGYLMIPILAALERWGLVAPCGAEVEDAAAVLETLAAENGPQVPSARNPAKELAERLAGRIPVVYASSPWLEAAARRWKCQFNENSKTLAACNAFPELNHNETVGWGAPPALAALFAVVVLLDGTEDPRSLRRIELTCDLAFGPAAGVHQVRAHGTGRLARLLSLVLTGDLVSVYLACLRGIDPTPIEIITTIKQGLRQVG